VVVVWERCSHFMDTATGPLWEVHDNCHSRQHTSCCAPSMSVLMWVDMVPRPCSGSVQHVLESGIQSAAVVLSSLNMDQQAACGIGLQVDAVRASQWISGPSLPHASARMHYCEGGVKRGKLRPAPLSPSGSIYPNHVAWVLIGCPHLAAALDVTRPPGGRWEQVCGMTCRARCMHVLIGGTTTPDGAGRGMVPRMHRAAVVGQSWVGTAWAPPRAVSCKKWITPPDVRALPTCRHLYNNKLSGTLPTEWSALSSVSLL
jgi:hypothetical protein